MSDGFYTVGQEVYILRADRGERVDMGDRCLFKIGRTKDYQSRMNKLQTGCPYPLCYMGGSLIGDVGASPVDVEGAAHRALAPYRTRGEWYECTLIQLYTAWRQVSNKYAPGSWDDEVPDQPWGMWRTEIANDNAA